MLFFLLEKKHAMQDGGCSAVLVISSQRILTPLDKSREDCRNRGDLVVTDGVDEQVMRCVMCEKYWGLAVIHLSGHWCLVFKYFMFSCGVLLIWFIQMFWQSCQSSNLYSKCFNVSLDAASVHGRTTEYLCYKQVITKITTPSQCVPKKNEPI